MKKVVLFFVCIIGITVAVFGGNILFVEYQEYKLKIELEKVTEQESDEEIKVAQQLAIQNLNFGKPIIQENNNWYIEIENISSGDAFGSIIVQFLDENNEVVLEENISLDSKKIKQYDKYVHNGYISSEERKLVKNYKIIDNNLFYFY